MRFYLYKGDRVSDGARRLVEELGATTLRAAGSSFTGRGQRALINWGSCNDESLRLWSIAQADRRFNNPEAIRAATNKLTALQRMRQAGVSIVPFWTNTEIDAAYSFAAGGGRVYARNQLNGHSGEGIQLILPRNDPQRGRNGGFRQWECDPERNGYRLEDFRQEFRHTQLFTQGITGHRKEWRVHVFQGRVILTQLKLRREGFAGSDQYTSLVRNVGTGWIYSVNFNRGDFQLTQVEAQAIESIRALGLDFGAVDIIQRDSDGQAFVLEVNTAPGLGEGGSTIEAYIGAFREWGQRFAQGASA